jgi:HD-GYP domain-containing protein (c-di-GMP phosphodiesterase class II)
MNKQPPYLETGRPGYVAGDSASILKTIFQVFPDSLFYLNQEGIIIDYLEGDSPVLYIPTQNFLGQRMFDVLPPNAADLFSTAFNTTMQSGQISTLEYDLQTLAGRRSYSARCVQINNSSLVVIIQDKTDQKRTTDFAHRQMKFMMALHESSRQFSRELDSQMLGQYVTHSCTAEFGIQQAWIGFVGPDHTVQELAYSSAEKESSIPPVQIKPTLSEVGNLLSSKTYLIVENVSPESGVWQVKSLFPLISHDQVVGVLSLLSDTEAFFDFERIDFFNAFSLLAASALDNSRLYESTQRQLSQLQTLRAIDQAILSTLDLKSMVEVILKEVAKHIHVDALALLLLDPKTQTLDFVDGFGFHFDTFKHSHLKVGESFAGQVALEKRVVLVENLKEDPKNFARALNFSEEGFMMYLGTPLIARSEVKGVLEIFQRTPFKPDTDWLTLLETLANQIAIAIDNALLVKSLQSSNTELSTAYDAISDGLSRALELRDRETQGHTYRVTEMTVYLAQRMGTSDTDLTHIRQGALLHDIGKMGVPDAILLKPGSLTSDEWKIMQQHPLYANDILSQIDHLKPAMDIPLYHHEKWNGTGYPKGLKGEQIPFAARLFALADVYDALTSDRPYRFACSKKEALDYIKAQSGIHFDPVILQLFVKLIQHDTFPRVMESSFRMPTKDVRGSQIGTGY